MSVATLSPEQIAALRAAGVELPPEMTPSTAPTPPAIDFQKLNPPPTPPPAEPAPAAVPMSVSERIAAMQTEGGGSGMSLADALAGLDGSKANARQYRLLPEDYDLEAQIVKAEIDIHNGKTRLRLELLTTHPKADAGVTLFDDVYLTQAALFRFKSLCEACELWENHAFTGKSEQEFVGCIVRFRVKTDTFNPEKPRSKVNGIFCAGYQTPGLEQPA